MINLQLLVFRITDDSIDTAKTNTSYIIAPKWYM